MKKISLLIVIVLTMLILSACLINSPTTSNLVKQDYPDNGYIFYGWAADNNCPLTIEAQGDYAYFVKLVDGSNNDVFAFFVYPGTIVTTKVPLGSYVIRYAAGTDWYGQTYLFGDDTAYYEAKNIFTFSEDNNSYNGFTMKISRQEGDNYGLDILDGEDF